MFILFLKIIAKPETKKSCQTSFFEEIFQFFQGNDPFGIYVALAWLAIHGPLVATVHWLTAGMHCGSFFFQNSCQIQQTPPFEVIDGFL